jgi:hypothetical protein
MSLLRQIQDATIATDEPLAAVLRRAKVLAARLDSPLLGGWVDHELNGYPDGATLPPYRARRPAAVLGDFDGLRFRASNAPMPRLAIPEQYRDGPLFHFAFSEPVAVYEELLRIQPGDLAEPWPSEAVAILRPRVFQGMTCVRAWRVVPRGDVIAVIDGVRNRLLDLVLELEREAPEAGEVPAAELGLSNEQVSSIIHMTIYGGTASVNDSSIHVHGTAGNLVGGQGNQVRQGDIHISQQTADMHALLGALRAAVEQLDGGLPPEQLDAVHGLIEDVEEAAAAPQPMRQRMTRTLKGITAIAGAAGQAGTAVIDAAQAIHRALGG